MRLDFNRLFPDRVKPKDRQPIPLVVGRLYRYKNEYHHSSYDAVVKLLDIGKHNLQVEIVSGDNWVVGSKITVTRLDLHLIE